MRVALDLETTCGLDCEGACEHALDPFRNRITVIGAYYERKDEAHRRIFRTLAELDSWLRSCEPGVELVGHNLKFDLRSLAAKGLELSHLWADDTMLMASTLTTKVSEEFLMSYELERKQRNSELPKGKSHREASLHSLKTLAPYFLKVPPFWEDPTNHDNEAYVLTDCEYTYRLAALFEALLKEEGTHSFYQGKLLPWTRMLYEMEKRGVALDLQALAQADQAAQAEAQKARQTLLETWAGAFAAYQGVQLERLRVEYQAMTEKALAKLKDPTPEKLAKTTERYLALRAKAEARVEPLNLDSHAQLTWLLKEHLKLDITDFDGGETTGKPVLARLSACRPDIATFLEYRKQQKLTQAFFPSYRQMQVEGAIHCSFNPAQVRTGRLSSSNPNLQQVPGHLHRLFVARPGYLLATQDESAIEPRLLCYYSGDKNLFDILAKGLDFHNFNTAIFFDLKDEERDAPDFKLRRKLERDVGKEVALALMYGAGKFRLMESAQKRGFFWSNKDASYKLDKFKDYYSDLFKYREEGLYPSLRARMPMTNLFGRQFIFENPHDVQMKGLNTLIQSSASDLVLESARRMSERWREKKLDARLLLLIHDEVVSEVPEEHADECTRDMTECLTDYRLMTPHGRVELKTEGRVAREWTK